MQTIMHFSVVPLHHAESLEMGPTPSERLQLAVWTHIPRHFAGSIRQVTFSSPTDTDPWKANVVISVIHTDDAEDSEDAENWIVEEAQDAIRAVQSYGMMEITMDDAETVT